MKKFVIITDSCSDLEKELRVKYDIDYVPMHYRIDGVDHIASLDWEELSAPDFYNVMRGGKRIYTAQVNAIDYKEKFESYLQKGFDILSISCSSALSNSVNSSYAVRDELLGKYPEAKIICVDSLNSCSGQGILCLKASELRSEGKTIEEVAEWVTSHRKIMHQEATVDKLTYLKQAGRVSATSAFFGGLLSVKPIIISDVNGQNVSVEKVKGRKTSFVRLAERVKERYLDLPYQKVHIGHADCLEEALELKKIVLETLGKDVEIHVSYIGPIVGASVGPGTLAVYFFGVEETHDSLAK